MPYTNLALTEINIEPFFKKFKKISWVHDTIGLGHTDEKNR